MNKLEYIEYEIEQNTKLRKELKETVKKKRETYKTAKEEFENSNVKAEIENKKQALLDLQRKQKKELDKFKAAQREKREKAEKEYLDIKDAKNESLSTLKEEMTIAIKAQTEARQRRVELRAEKKKLKNIGEVHITSHSIVQYLNRARGVDIGAIRKEIQDKRVDDGKEKLDEVPDHIVVEFLKNEGRIDVEEIEKAILPQKIKSVLLSDELAGSTGTYSLPGGFRIVAKGGKIVTFLPKVVKQKSRKRRGKKVKRKIRKMKI